MKYHTQQHIVIRDEQGNIVQDGSCYPTIYACILDLELDQVPYFHLLYLSSPKRKENLSKYHRDRYLGGSTIEEFQGEEHHKSNYYHAVSISMSLWDMVREMWLASIGYKEEWITDIDQWLKENKDIPYIVSGDSARGVTHVVIYQNGEMIHDPHPNRDGLVKLGTNPFSYLKKIND